VPSRGQSQSAVFAQTAAETVRTRLNVVAEMLGQQFPQVKTMLLDAATDITAFADFPSAHWKKIWSTNTTAAHPFGVIRLCSESRVTHSESSMESGLTRDLRFIAPRG
jgi:transposase-like protein